MPLALISPRCFDDVVRLLFGVRVPEDAHSVEVRPVFTGSSRPRLIFQGPLARYGQQLADNDIADALARDVRFWRWIRSEERARRLRTEHGGRVVRFRLSLTFRDGQSELIVLHPERGQTYAVTPRDEQFDNETIVRF